MVFGAAKTAKFELRWLLILISSISAPHDASLISKLKVLERQRLISGDSSSLRKFGLSSSDIFDTNTFDYLKWSLR